MDIFDRYATDESAELNGVEVPMGDATLLIARVGNKKYSNKLTALVKRHEVALAIEGDAADALNESLMVEAIADTILLGWKNLQYKVADAEGALKRVELPYSKENAKMILGHHDFRADVMKLANDMEAYKVKQEEAAGKP